MRLSWKQLASIEIGGAICLPVILIGHTLCMKYGFVSALIAILAGNLFLFAIALFSARLSVEKRYTTPEMAEQHFGPRGVRLFALILMLTKLGWFAIQLTMMSESIRTTFGLSIPLSALNIGLGCLIVLVALFGLRAIGLLSSASLPMMVGTMLLALYFGAQRPFTILPSQGLGIEAISVAIAAAITAVLDMPTYFRFAKSPKDAYIAVGSLFLLALPLIETVGVLLASFHPGKSMVTTLLGTSFLWNCWVTLFFILAGWTTNNTNLYSANICFGALLKHLPEPKRIALLGTFGIALSLVPLLPSFTLGLQIMGIAIGALGGVIYTSHFWGSSRNPLLTWGIATTIGWLSLSGLLTLTSIPLCDSFCVAILATSLLKRRVLT
jgi:cytosine permease